MRATVAWAAAGTALSLSLLVACGSSTGTSQNATATSTATGASSITAANTGAHNVIDVAFVTTLSQLGNQSLTMADLVAQHATHPALTSVATSIQQRHRDVDAMLAWMREWHQTLPTPAGSTSPATDAYLQSMAAMHGNLFDDDWLEHMGANYTAAIAACQQELDHGTNTQARQLASTWMAAMHSEYGQIQQWHSSWEHDSRFPATGTAAATPPQPGTTQPHASDTSHPGSTHMSNTPHVSEMPHASDTPHPTSTTHMDDGHMSNAPHMSSTHS